MIRKYERNSLAPIQDDEYPNLNRSQCMQSTTQLTALVKLLRNVVQTRRLILAKKVKICLPAFESGKHMQLGN